MDSELTDVSPGALILEGVTMLTIQPNTLSVVQLTALKPGDLFQYSGQHGSYVAMLVQNETPHYASWLRLTGDRQFRMQDTGPAGSVHYARAPKVLRLGIQRSDLRVQIDQTHVKRAAAGTLHIGCLLIREKLHIVTFSGDGDVHQDELSGVALSDLSCDSVDPNGRYICDKWQLVHVPHGLPPEVIAEFSPAPFAETSRP